MASSHDIIYASLAAEAFLVSFLLVPLVTHIGRRSGFVDAVRPDKIHEEPKVRCGGVAIFLSFIVVLLANLLLATYAKHWAFVPEVIRAVLPNVGSVSQKLLAILTGASVLFLTGLIDDRKTLPPLPKLMVQIISALPLIWAGISIKLFIPGVFVGALFTIVWVVLLTNSFNFIDNMNGLSSGVAAVVAFLFYLVSRSGGEYFMMGILAVLFGAILGFVPHNFPRAKLFMGDSGSLFIGYMLAALSIMVTYYERGVPTQAPVVAPLIILGVPIFDTISVMYIRFRSGKPLMKGDQNHFSHRLVALGFSRTAAVLFIYLVTLTVGLAAVNLRFLDWTGATLALAQVVLFFFILYLLERAANARIKSDRERNHGTND